MTPATHTDFFVPTAKVIRPWHRAHWLAGLLCVFAVAIVAANLILRHATACVLQTDSAEAWAVALGVLAIGAFFYWVPIDVWLSGWLPQFGHLSIALSILMSVLLMVTTIRAVFLAQESRRGNMARAGWLALASALVGMYATSSALGFCVLARPWLLWT